MSADRHAAAKAQATLNYVLNATSAFDAFELALKDERRLLALKLQDPRDDIARRSWETSCAVLAASIGKLDAAIRLLENSARLAREMVS